MSWPRSSAAEEVEMEGRGTALRTPTGCFQQACREIAVGIGVAGEEENDGCPENYWQPVCKDSLHVLFFCHTYKYVAPVLWRDPIKDKCINFPKEFPGFFIRTKCSQKTFGLIFHTTEFLCGRQKGIN